MDLKTIKRKLKLENAKKVLSRPILLISHTAPLSGEEDYLLLSGVVPQGANSLKISPETFKLSAQKRILSVTVAALSTCRIYYFNSGVDGKKLLSVFEFLKSNKYAHVLGFHLFNVFMNASRSATIFPLLFTFGLQTLLLKIFFRATSLSLFTFLCKRHSML